MNMRYAHPVIAALLLAIPSQVGADTPVQIRIADSLTHSSEISLGDSLRLQAYVSAIRSWLITSEKVDPDSVDVELERLLKGKPAIEVVRMAKLARIAELNVELKIFLDLQSSEVNHALDLALQGGALTEYNMKALAVEPMIKGALAARARELPKLEMMQDKESRDTPGPK